MRRLDILGTIPDSQPAAGADVPPELDMEALPAASTGSSERQPRKITKLASFIHVFNHVKISTKVGNMNLFFGHTKDIIRHLEIEQDISWDIA